MKQMVNIDMQKSLVPKKRYSKDIDMIFPRDSIE